MTQIETLAASFAGEWWKLNNDHKRLLVKDFRLMLHDEYDTPDPTMDRFTEEQNTSDAAIVYRNRIGRGNLLAYCRSLAAGENR